MTNNGECPLRFFRVSDLRKEIPKTDYHLHTSYTDGEGTIEDYIIRGLELGLEAISFPEHANRSSTWLPAFRSEIEILRQRYRDQIDVSWGIESKAVDYEGTLAASSEIVEAVDIVYGAFHAAVGGKHYSELSKDEAIEMEFRVLLGLAEHGTAHVLAHPGAVSDKYQGGFPREFFSEIAQAAASHDVAIEINSEYAKDLPTQLSICHSVGANIVLGSNAHSVDRLGDVQRTLEELRRAGSF